MRDEPLTISAVPGTDASITILKLQGLLTLQSIFGFQEKLGQHKPQLLIIDLTESPYIDSAGLGSLMNGYVSAERADAASCWLVPTIVSPHCWRPRRCT
jgi:anti-anti-sigma regulatory factor